MIVDKIIAAVAIGGACFAAGMSYVTCPNVVTCQPQKGERLLSELRHQDGGVSCLYSPSYGKQATRRKS